MTTSPLEEEEFAAYAVGRDGLLPSLRQQLADALDAIPFDRVSLHFDVEPEKGKARKLSLRRLGPTTYRSESLFWAECRVTNANFFALSHEERWSKLCVLVGEYFNALSAHLEGLQVTKAKRLATSLEGAVRAFLDEKRAKGFPAPRGPAKPDMNPVFVGLRLVLRVKRFLSRRR